MEGGDRSLQRGSELVDLVEEKKQQLDREEAARIVAQANAAAKSIDEMEVERQKRSGEL